MVEVSLESRLEIFLSCALFFFFRLDVSSFRVFTLRSVAATLSLSLSHFLLLEIRSEYRDTR